MLVSFLLRRRLVYVHLLPNNYFVDYILCCMTACYLYRPMRVILRRYAMVLSLYSMSRRRFVRDYFDTRQFSWYRTLHHRYQDCPYTNCTSYYCSSVRLLVSYYYNNNQQRLVRGCFCTRHCELVDHCNTFPRCRYSKNTSCCYSFLRWLVLFHYHNMILLR